MARGRTFSQEFKDEAVRMVLDGGDLGEDVDAVPIFEYIEGFHNRTRHHSALGWKTPQEFEQHHQHMATISSPT